MIIFIILQFVSMGALIIINLKGDKDKAKKEFNELEYRLNTMNNYKYFC